MSVLGGWFDKLTTNGIKGHEPTNEPPFVKGGRGDSPTRPVEANLVVRQAHRTGSDSRIFAAERSLDTATAR